MTASEPTPPPLPPAAPAPSRAELSRSEAVQQYVEERVRHAYDDRNLAVAALLAVLAARTAYRLGVKDAHLEEPRVYADLPQGQVSWRLPRDVVAALNLPQYIGRWDGHSSSDKRERVRSFIGLPPREDIAAAIVGAARVDDTAQKIAP